jgi:hypothetical protein
MLAVLAAERLGDRWRQQLGRLALARALAVGGHRWEAVHQLRRAWEIVPESAVPVPQYLEECRAWARESKLVA